MGRIVRFITNVPLWPSFLKAHQFRQNCGQGTICTVALFYSRRAGPVYHAHLPPPSPPPKCQTSLIMSHRYRRRYGHHPSCPTHVPLGALLFFICSRFGRVPFLSSLMNIDTHNGISKINCTKILKEDKIIFNVIV